MSICSRCTSCTAGIMCQCVKSKKKEKSNVDHPDHYMKGSGFEVIDVIKAWKLDFELGNAVKYIGRAGKKNSERVVEDLEKAAWYINHKINTLKK